MRPVNPLISVVIPTYNRVAVLARALSSVLDQRVAGVEVLVVDDGSDDDTASVLKNFNDPALRYVVKEHDGAPSTRNRGIEEAAGDWIIWLDSDDELMPGVLQHYVSLIESHPDIDIFYGDLRLIEPSGMESTLTFLDYVNETNLVSRLIRGTIIPNPGTMVRKSLYSVYGSYDTRFRRAHDFEFWSRALESAKLQHAGCMVCRYHWHGNNLSAGQVDKSFEAGVVKLLCQRHPLTTLFPELDWRQPLALTDAWKKVASILTSCGDTANAAIALRNAIVSLPADMTGLARNVQKRQTLSLIESLPESAGGELHIPLCEQDSAYSVSGDYGYVISQR